MDYETRQDSDGELGSGQLSNGQLGSEIAAAAEAASRTGGIVLMPDAQNQIVLPEGATLDDLEVRGRDLVIELADGRVFVIPNGAVYVPEIVVGGVAVPPLNLAALLANPAQPDGQPTPADIALRSSGGNFAEQPRPLQAATGIGNLLPYTELNFPAARQPEVIPDKPDRVPTTIIITPDNPAGAVSATASVNEAGLPARGNEPEGSNAAANSETTTGSIVFTAPDGVASITLNGVAITTVGQTFTTPRGVLTITSIAPGNYGYSYTLTDNTNANTNPMDVFAVVVTDSDGDTASADLTITIVDDAPTARNDTDTVPAANYSAQIGNVVTGANTTSGATGADTKGADDATVTGFRAGTTGAFAAAGTTVNGAYGKLTFDAAGNYTYTRNPGTPGGVTDTFSYQLTDGDTDNSVATLVITITDSPAVVTSVPTTGGATTVNESGLPARPGEPEGSNSAAPSETASGTITFAAPDGVASVAINGITVTGAGQVIALPTGTFTVTAFNPAAGTLSYTFTLADNTSGDTTVQTISVTVTDIDGDFDTKPFNITIVDDVPTARNDAATQTTENATVTLNVITGAGTTTGAAGADTPGADGVNLTTGIAAVPGTLSGAGTLIYNNNGAFTYNPAPGEQGTVTFQYRITDGDGDTSTATVTITLLRDSVPSVSVTGDNTVDEAALPARPGEPAGSNAASSDETATGTINIATGGDTLASLVINGTNVTAGGTVAGAHGTLTVTLNAGVYSYSYTLTDNTLGDATTDPFTVVVTDSDTDTASTTLTIAIADDVPTAVNDTDSIASGTYGPATGNVITDAEADGGKDTPGADGVTVTAISGFGGAGSVGGSTTGQYGTLTLGADGTYSYTRSAGTKGGVSDTFTYTITDADGDTSSATLVVTIDDAAPVTGANATVLLDDDALTGGNAGGTGDDANAANLTGTLAGSGGDGPLTWAFAATGAPAGFSYVANGTGIDVFQGLTKVLTVTLNAANGGYTVTQNAPIVHANGADENNQPFALSYSVTDQDSDVAGGTLSIDVDDDTPLAANDTDAVTEDTATTATGNVLTGAGSDGNAAGADSIGADGPAAGGAVTAIAGGTVGVAFGTAYGTLTLNANGSYTYALNNALPAIQGLDGNDSLSESFTYTITDKDGDTATAVLLITINGSDDPITITGLSAQGPDEIVDEDDLSDGSSPNAAAFTQTGNFTVTGVDGITSVKVAGVEAFVGQTVSTAHGVFTITSISAPADGASTSIVVGYSYQLTDNTAHPNANGENSLTETFSVAVTDTDGSTATDQVEVLIVDDVPTAVNDTDTIASGTYGPATGNVITDVEADGGTDTPGADGVTVTAISGFGGAGTVGGSTTGQYGTLTLGADGTYSYTRTAGTKGGVSDTFSYTITDSDGDTSTATLVITIDDATPLTGANATVLLDDDALAGGNPGGTGDDANAANLTGTLAASGGDGPLTWAFATSGAPAGFSYVANGTGVDVFQGATKVLTVTLNAATGGYTVTQNAPIVHASGSDENNQPFTLTYSITDQDLDSANGSLSINIDDDTPTAVNDTDAILSGSNAPATGNVITDAEGDGGADSVGADGGAAVVAITGFGGAGSVGGTTTGQWGTLTLNADGSYSYVRASGSPGNVSDVFTYTLTDKDGDTTTATLTIDIEDARPVTGTNAAVLLDDDALAGGNAGGTGDDADAANLSGTLAGSGGDGALTWAFATTGAPLGFSYVANGTGIDVFQGLTKVMTVTLNAANGGYTVTQNAPIVHAAGGDENNQPFTLNYSVTDVDLDSASGTLTIDVDDDTPTAVNDFDTIAAGTYGPATGNVITDAEADGGKDSVGADGGAAIVAITGFGGAGTVGGSTTGQYGTLTMNAGGGYSYTRSAGTKGGVSDSFTYTLTDADGDTTTATLLITIDDATPLTGANAQVQLDDDALANGNAGGTGDDANSVGTTGTLAGSGGDGPLTWAYQTTGAPAGFSYVANGTGIDVFQGLTKVLTVTLNAATGAYTVVQNAPIVHASGSDENNQSFTLNYSVTDQDLDSANGTIVIDVDDDSPIAVNDTDSLLAGATGPATGNVITDTELDGGKDSVGADGGAAVVAITGFGGAGTVGGTTTGQYGTLTLNADGSYSYSRSTTGPLNANDTFTYTLTDTDGDTTTATLTITIADAGPSTGANAAVQLDDDALAGGNAGGTGDDANAVNTTGTLAASGGDGALTWAYLTTGAPAGFTYTPNGTSLEVFQGATKVLTLTLNPATGAYTVTQNAPILHASGADENNQPFTITYKATDADGDSANGTIVVDVDDDTPTAVNDTDALLAGATGPATGNVITDAELDGGKDSVGADGGAAVVAITGFGGAGTVGGTTTGQYGTLTMNANGGYSYSRSGTGAINATDTFTYTLTDADGDTTTATLAITLQDAAPATALNATVLLDDDALAGGNAGGIGDDANAANLTGTLAGSGGDGALTWAYQTTGAPAGFSYVANGTGIDVFQGLTKVMTVTLNAATGAYTVVQNAPIVHASGSDENNQPFTLSYTVTDADGDSAGGTLAIDVDDDTPTAVNDTDSLLAGATGPATGNVITDAELDGGKDSVGADGGAAVVAITGFGGAGTVGGSTTGQYGTLTMNANGGYSYTRTGTGPINATDTFTYTLTDTDGDTTTATLTITLADAAPSTGVNAQILLDDDALTGGNAAGTGDDANAANTSGTLAGSGGDGALTWAYQTTGAPAGFSYVANGSGIDVFQGLTKVLTLTLNTTTGAYVVGQVAPIVHPAGSDENNQAFTVNYSVTDADGDSAGGTISIDVDDDSPIAVNDTDTIAAGTYGPATGNVITDAELDGGKDSVGADGGAAVIAITGFGGAGTVGGSTTGQYGTLTMNANGGYSYTRSAGTSGGVSDTFTYTLTDADGDTTTATLIVTINDATPLTGANAQVQLDDDALANGNAGGIGDDPNATNTTGTLAGSGGDGPLTWAFATTGAPAGFSYVANGTGIDVFQGLTKVLTVTLNAANGGYTVAQNAPIVHASGSDENNQPFTLSYTVKDQDLDSAGGTLVIDVDDDTPIAIQPIATTMNNAIGASGGNFLDDDNDVDNDYGADGAGKVVFTAATITSLIGQNLASGFASLNYALSAGDTVLTATKSTDNSVVFTISLQPVGSPDQYVVNISQKLDSSQAVDFNGGGYDFVGGNGSWAGFVPVGEPSPGGTDNNSQDLLLTPIGGGTVNTNANEGGVAGGNSVGAGEAVRVDFVVDLRGAPVSGGNFYGGDDTQNFDGHYTVNGAGALFTSINTTSIVTLKAFDDADSGTVKNVGDGVPDAINKIAISHGAVTTLITTSGVHVVDGISYTVLFAAGIVTVSGVVDSTRLAGFTANGYNSIEFGYGGGNTFKIGDFGASRITNSPVGVTVPVSIQDADGDAIASASILLTLSPTTPPVVLDLDGDGAEFLSTAAGVAYDYGSGLVSTAWVGPDDGLLAIDRNGDGLVTGAEIVFGGNAASDLQGLAAQYDSNGDGQLSAADAAFAQFGVWQDANSNGVTDAGEFRSLADMGIASVSLVSDGQTATAANGDVTVHGSTTYTRTDGTTGTVADASFATAAARAAARGADVVNAAVAGMALIAADQLAAQPAAVVHEDLATGLGLGLDSPLAEAQQGIPASRIELVPEDDMFADLPGRAAEPLRDAAGLGAERFAPTTTELEHVLERFSGDLDQPGAQPLADRFGSGELFHAAAPPMEQAMEALLMAAGPIAGEVTAGPGQHAADLPEIREALDEARASDFVDHLVTQLAGGGDAPLGLAGGGADNLADILGTAVSAGPDIADTSSFFHQMMVEGHEAAMLHG